MLLQLGDSGSQVRELQERLMQLGYDIGGTVTGYFGNLTDSAVREFQADFGLSDDGIVGNGTWSVMQLGKPVLKLNCSVANQDYYVRILQNRLTKQGYKCSINGSFGQSTHNQVVSFQSNNTLTDDGIVGVSTWEKLYDSNAIPSNGYLRIGSQGDSVKILQNTLNNVGYDAGVADGIFGNGTHNAVTKFQADNGLVADGIVGPLTWESLEIVNETIKYGSSGAAVIKLQNRLNELGYNVGAADGIFGDGTHVKVQDFQTNNSLIADGVVGPLTWAKLLSDNANGPSAINNIILQFGSRGSDVTWLQNRLLTLDYSVGHSGADGIFGVATKNAVMEFQANNNLTVDGIVGAATWSMLHSIYAANNSIDSWGFELIRKGRRGDDVRDVQVQLISLGYSCGTAGADGIFGISTYNAVLEFQRLNDLTEDGIVGQHTYNKLFSNDSVNADYSDSFTNILKYGSRSEAVLNAQKQLMNLGYDLGRFGADGVFGDDTFNAVRIFQLYNDLMADGIVGPLTHSKLYHTSAVTYEEGNSGNGGFGDPSFNFTGDNIEDAIDHMINTALGEVGYRAKKSYSIYGGWYGHPNSYWCNMFVSWCANKASIMDCLIPRASYTESSRNWFINRNAWKTKGSGYIPKKGDCIYFKYPGADISRNVSHIGLVVEDSLGSIVKTVEGNLTCADDNSYSEVRLCEYSLANSLIVGYGSIYDVASNIYNYEPPINECGGLESSNVDVHQLSYIKSSSMFECKRCDKSFKSPILQDKSILSHNDYIFSKGLFLLHGLCEEIDQKMNLFHGTYNSLYTQSAYVPTGLLACIDDIRSKYNGYEYSNNGKYKRVFDQYYSYGLGNFWHVKHKIINDDIDLGVENGIFEALLNIIGAIFLPSEWATAFTFLNQIQSPNPSLADVMYAIVGGANANVHLNDMMIAYDICNIVSNIDSSLDIGDHYVELSGYGAQTSETEYYYYIFKVYFNSEGLEKKTSVQISNVSLIYPPYGGVPL